MFYQYAFFSSLIWFCQKFKALFRVTNVSLKSVWCKKKHFAGLGVGGQKSFLSNIGLFVMCNVLCTVFRVQGVVCSKKFIAGSLKSSMKSVYLIICRTADPATNDVMVLGQ